MSEGGGRRGGIPLCEYENWRLETETEKERSGYRDAEWSNREMGVNVATGFCWPEEEKMSGSFVISETVVLTYYSDLRSGFAVRVDSRNLAG